MMIFWWSHPVFHRMRSMFSLQLITQLVDDMRRNEVS